MTHIRKPHQRTFRTSSSGFVRRGASPDPETFCGAAPTDRDATARDWKAYQRAGEEVCPACVEAAA